MLFPKKIRRVVDVDKIDRELKEGEDRPRLEKGDLKAMIIAGLIVFLPAAILVMALMVGIPYLLFNR